MTADIEGCKKALAHLDIDDKPASVKAKSRDFFWYSPVLKERMDHLVADFVVTPKSEADVIEALAAAYAHDVPVTTRGSGTGNYGQAMPLSGGVVLHLKDMNRVLSIEPGRLRAEAGAVLVELDRETRTRSGQEMRMHPSTYETASIGGFVAGGSGGVGSIRWGGLRAPGNILGLKLITMEASPRVLELRGDDIQKANHAYGVNGIITEVEVPLTQAFDWIDVLVGFDDFEGCVRYGYEIAHQDGILLKEAAPIEAPIPQDYFIRHKKFLRDGQSVCVMMVAPQAMEAFLTWTDRWKGAEIVFRSDRDDTDRLPAAYLLTWNHTTLRALRVDPTITYLQVQYGSGDGLEKLAHMRRLFGQEVPAHIEVTRFDGEVMIGGLPLVRYTTEERLEEIMRIHEDNGCWVFNPHRCTLEEGGMKQSDPIQVEFKRQTDPKGLLNPGKMIAWDDPNWDFSTNRLYTYAGLSAR